jgi:hypothetical protein
MCGSKGTQTVTQQQQTQPNPAAYSAYLSMLGRAGNVAGLPFVPFPGQGVAPINPTQLAGIGQIATSASLAQPGYEFASMLDAAASNPLTAGNIMNYYNPFQQQVVSNTENWLNTLNAQQQQQVIGNAAAQGALGGDRSAIAQAITAQGQAAAEAPVISGLEAQGYNQALQTAAQQYQQNPEQAAAIMASLAAGQQGAALAGGQALTQAGTLQQQTQQAQDQFAYQQYLQQQGFPYQVAQWLAGIYTGVGSQMGGTGTAQTQQPAPSWLASALGLGITGAGMYANSQNPNNTNVFSDERLKEDAVKVGETKDGQPIYRFKFKGDPRTHIGLMAQDVEKKHPEAVGLDASGYKTVDYEKATDHAVKRKGYQGGGVPTGPGYTLSGGFAAPYGGPYGGGGGLYGGGGSGITHGAGPPRISFLPPQQQQQQQGGQDILNNALKMAGKGVGPKGSVAPGGMDDPALQSATPGIGDIGLAGDQTASVAGLPGADVLGGADVGALGDVTAGMGGDLLGGSFDLASTLPAIGDIGLGTDALAGLGGAMAGGDLLAGGDALMALALLQSGGRANYPGGIALPARNRINLPMRGGLGMPSFVRGTPQKGYQEGGSPQFADPSDTVAEAIMKNQEIAQELTPQSTDAGLAAFNDTSKPNWQRVGLSGPPSAAQLSDADSPQAAAMANTIRRNLSGSSPMMSASYAPGSDAASAIANVVGRPRTGMALGFAGAPGEDGGVGGGYTPTEMPTPPPASRRTPPTALPDYYSGSPGSAMIAAGLGILSRVGQPGVTTAGAIFGGGAQGLAGYLGGQASAEMEARKLDQAAKAEQDRINIEGQRLDVERYRAGLEQLQPLTGYETPEGHPIGIDKRRPGVAYDLVTGKQVDPDTGVRNTRLQWKPYPNKITEGGDPVMQNGQGQFMNATTHEIMGPGTKIIDAKINPIPEQDVQSRAYQLGLGDMKSAYSGFGYGDSLNKQRVRTAALKQLTDNGMTVQEASEYLSNQEQEWHARGMGLGAEARTAATREANLKMILRAADAAVPAALDASKDVWRTGFVPLNHFIQSAMTNTGSPQEIKFGMANLQLAEHWARAMNPTGQMRESDRDLALKYLNTAQNPEAYQAAVKQLQVQIQREQNAVAGFRKDNGRDATMGKSDGLTAADNRAELNKGVGGGATTTTTTTTPAPTATTPPATVDARDIQALKDNADNPAAKAAIDKKYGAGTADRILGKP